MKKWIWFRVQGNEDGNYFFGSGFSEVGMKTWMCFRV